MAVFGKTIDVIRETAHALMKVLEQHHQDEVALRRGISTSLEPLLARPDLLDWGVSRLDSHSGGSKILYYDPGVRITINRFPPSLDMAAHDHAPWEALSLYRGRFKHTAYERVDDGSKLGYAKLNIIEDRVLEPGEFAMIYPPKDIHSFHGLTEDTWAVFVASGVPSPERKYFNTVDNTYIQRLKEDPKALAPKH